MMESPVVVENCANFATPVQSGFPFDDNDSHDHFEARLNDLVQRHPELADHLRFPSLRRKRYGSGSAQDQDEPKAQATHPGASTSNSPFHAESRRFGEHAFPSGFNRFPFTHHFEDFEPRRDDKPPEVPKTQEGRGRKPNPYLPQHLSNTVDLGQKQTPVEEKRSQRSMSAPPENRSAHNVSSARVQTEPLNAQQPPEADMGKSFSKQSPQPQPASQPRERIIPIHVEGRDDPVIPKSTHTHTHAAAPEKVFGGERVHHPTYQQYSHANQYPRQHQQAQYPKHGYYEPYAETVPTAKSTPTKQMPPSQQTHAREPSPAPPTAQQHHHQQQQQHKQQTQAPPQPHHATPPPTAADPLQKIKCVRNDVMELMNQVEKFNGTKKDRQYMYLDEMLTRNLLKLDNIETEGKENIRQARKEAIKCIQTCINKLEAQAQEMELKRAAESAPESTTMEAEVLADASQAKPEPAKTEHELKMETEEVANKPVFKSEATLLISGADSEKRDAESPLSTMEVEPVTTEASAAPALADQTAAVMETEPVAAAAAAAAAADAAPPADVNLEPAVDSTSSDTRPAQAPSSQPSEAPATQK